MIVILGIISVIIFQFFSGSVRLYQLASTYTRLGQIGRNCLARICRDTRSARAVRARTSQNDGRLDLQGVQATPLDDAAAIIYFSDIGRDGLLIRSRRDGTAPSENPLAADLALWAPACPLTDNFIRMLLTLQLPSGEEIEFRTGATLRNREDNLRPPRQWREVVN